MSFIDGERQISKNDAGRDGGELGMRGDDMKGIETSLQSVVRDKSAHSLRYWLHALDRH